MDSSFYDKGYLLTLKNAETLLKNSELIAENGDFGLACSLNILSAEEAVKTIYILLKKFDYLNEIQDDYNQIFISHKFKHQQIKEMMTVYDIHILRLDELFKSYNLTQYKTIVLPDEKNQFKNLIEIQKTIEEYFSDEITIDKIISWLNNANTDKNNGLYVGYKNKKWNSPENFKEEKFIQENKYTKKIINMTKQFEYIQEQVKVYINQSI